MKNFYALPVKFWLRMFTVLLFVQLSFNSLNRSAFAQAVNFSSSALVGESLANPTSLQFGPDNRLYVSQQNGVINVYTIKKNAPNNYSVTATESIQLIKNIPNHNDDGTLNTTVINRQITGILVVGTSAIPIIYVTSSDPRIGGGGTAGDNNQDTNSGIISKLTRSGTSWVKVDLVKGLPRSEENHSSNGLALDAATNTLYVAQGGHTNAGSPSNNFAFLTEYALSAAILKINLNLIQTSFGGSYTLPTLDDPTRANTGGADVNDPWGGNDGINQAKLVAGGPVQIHSAGYRNAYDLVITKTPGKTGRMYTIDNGANGGWGGYPDLEGTSNVTNKYVVGEPGSTTAGVNDAKVNNLDNLHLVSAPGMTPIYGGHPNPIRANPAGAGIYTFNNTTGVGSFSLNPTVDWPPVPVSMANPVQSNFRNPGVNDGALYTWSSSTNGIAEYTSNSFSGAMLGDLLAASFDGNIYRIKLNTAGTAVSAVTILAGGFGSQPLDVTAQPDNGIFPGTIWAATYGANSITIFEPVGSGTCSGDINNFSLDDDADGYSNGDETANGTDPCSSASKPQDFDGDFISDLTDPDDDNDALNDQTDKFALDKFNGTTTNMPIDYPFLNGNPGFGLFGLGFTGLMCNNTTNYQAQFDLSKPNLVMGGAVGIATAPAEAGSPQTNNQKYAFQFGVKVSQSTPAFTIQSKLLGSSFFDGATGTQLGTQSQGIYFGTGDQDSYIKLVLHANTGNPGFQILVENGGVVSSQTIFPVSNILAASSIDVYMDINPATGLVQCRYKTNSAATPVNIGPAMTMSGNLLTVLQNTNAIAVGLIASAGNKVPFTASWDYLKVTSSVAQTLTEVVRINAGGPATQFGTELWKADQYFTGGSTFTTTSAISNTTNDALYQTERFGNFTYNIPVPQTGKYTIDLHFAELYFSTAGSRVFNLSVEGGQFALQNIDLYKDYGGKLVASVIKAQNVQVNDGFLTITLTNVINNAKISGISVFLQSDGTAVNRPPIVTQPPNITLSPGQFWSYQVIASDPDAGAVLTYSSSNLPASLTLNATTGLISGSIEATSGSPYTVTLTVKDQQNSSASTSFVITISSPGALTEVVRINAGGPAVQFGTELWKADQYFTGGSTFTTTSAISNTTNDALYQTERFGNITYNIPVPQTGNYTVNLHFAELYFSTAGSRVFSLSLENGQFVLPNIDLFKDYGGKLAAAIIKAQNIQVNDGFITITLTNVINNAKISGIAVFLQAAGANQAPTANAGPDKTITLPTSSVSLTGSGSDPENGTNVTYAWTQVSGPNTAIFSSAVVASPTVTGLVAGTYVFSLIVKDQQLLSSAADLVSVLVNPAAGVQQVTSFTLINADTEQDIQTISPNTAINRASLPTQNLNVRANTSPGIVGSVVFALSGTQIQNRTETGVPYALFGDGNGNYNSWTPAIGSYTLKATPFSAASGGGTPGTSLTINFSVINQAANTPPVLALIGNKSVNELQSLSFTVSATDNDVPANVLTYSLVNPATGTFPTGATLNSATRVFNWTPTEPQGPGTYRVKVVVSDGSTTDEEEIQIIVSEVNTAPVLAAIGNKSISELVQLNFTAVGTDSDVPLNNLTYSLATPATGVFPTGAAINSSSGAFTWIPSAAQGPGTYRVKVVVSDGILSAQEEIQISVSEVNTPPILALIGNKSVNELQLLNFIVSATDSDVPANVLTYSLANPATGIFPTGATLNSATRVFNWTPTEPQGPGTYRVKVVVSDGSLNNEEEIEISVAEVNTPPVLAVIGNKSIDEQQTLSFIAMATDSDIPLNTLVFSLVSSATGIFPGGATITPAGQFSWTPLESQGGGIYNVIVKVFDGSITDDEEIQITVNEVNTAPDLAIIGNQSVTELQELSFIASATDSDVPSQTISFSLDAASVLQGMSINAATGAFLWTPSSNQGGITYPVTITATDNGNNPNNLSNSKTFNIVVNDVNNAPVITFSPASSTIIAGDAYSAQVLATDPDAGDALTFSGTGFPNGLSIDPGIGFISGTVSNSSGVYTITLTVTDSHGATAQASFEITVNNRPVFTQIPDNPTTPEIDPTILNINDVWNFDVDATDADAGAVLTYQAFGLPSNLSIDGTTGFISGSVNTPGTYPVSLTVTDEDGLFASFNFNIIVQEPAAPFTNSLALNESLKVFRRTSNKEIFSVYPNPAQKDLSVQLTVKERSEWKFVLYNTLGNLIQLPTSNFEKGISRVSFDLRPYNLAPGMYYLVMTNNLNERKTSKIIIE